MVTPGHMIYSSSVVATKQVFLSVITNSIGKTVGDSRFNFGLFEGTKEASLIR